MKRISPKQAKSQGLARYFTGKPCKNGHIYERYTASRKCRKCTHVKVKKFSGLFKFCTSCKKKLKKIPKNFRYKSKKQKVLTFRPVCRICGREQVRKYNITLKGKLSKQKRDKSYVASGGRKTKTARAKACALSNLRRARIMNATPKWFTEEHKKEIQKIYMSCPKGYHVDHFIPLKGKNVCGLHVPNNLRIITAYKNLSKGVKLI